MAYLLSRSLRFVPLVLAMAAANYVIDPSHVFHAHGYARTIADLLLNGHNVANAGNFDDRLMAKYYVAGLREPKDVIVLGSSRTMQIRAWMFPGQSFFNSSVHSARLPELIAIYELYAQKGIEPSTVLIGMDPWTLHDSSVSPHLLSLKEEYEAGLARLGMKTETEPLRDLRLAVEPYGALFSPSYLRQTVREVLRRPGGGYYVTDNEEEVEPVRVRDGSYSYERAKQRRSALQVRQEILAAAAQRGGGGQVTLDPALCALFTAFVNRVADSGVRVIIVLPPFHPLTYARMTASGEGATASQVERYVASLAARDGVVVAGSFDPAASDCTEADFYDGTHPKPQCMLRMLRRAAIAGMPPNPDANER